MRALIILVTIIFLSGCQQKGSPKNPADVILINKYIKIEKGGGMEIMEVEFFDYKVWIEGTIKNIGDLPANNIKIVFKVLVINDIYIEDNISYLAPGESILFKTSSCQTMDSNEPYIELQRITFN